MATPPGTTRRSPRRPGPSVARQLRALRRDAVTAARAQQARWRFRMRRGRAEFDRDVHQWHARFRQSLPAYVIGANPWSLLTAPVIYALLVPFALLDLWVSLYQWICFPIYGIAPVRRRAYFALDRHTLQYLNAIEKVNCTFCAYANGLIAYVREVAARTEQYWCPIKHARAVPSPHARYHRFFDYGDAASYRRRLGDQRARLRGPAPP